MSGEEWSAWRKRRQAAERARPETSHDDKRRTTYGWDWDLTDKKTEQQRQYGSTGSPIKSSSARGTVRYSSTSASSSSSSAATALMVPGEGVEPGWGLRDLMLAASLLDDTMKLRKQQQNDISYANEAEMRRVFELVYDVLRYEQVLERALNDVSFWQRYPKLRDRRRAVWLLLYDMQGRKFARAGGGSSNQAQSERDELFAKADLVNIEQALLSMKTRLAASLTRLRIAGSALTLDELLPSHLRSSSSFDHISRNEYQPSGYCMTASGWVNSAKLPTRDLFITEMRKLGLRLCSRGSNPDTAELMEDQYLFDTICPRLIHLHESAREKMATSRLVTENAFVFLDRSLCVGAASLVRIIRLGKMCGPVILTHPLAPKHTGYLAVLLADIENIGRLLVFSLGSGLEQHQAYLENLGVPKERFKLFAERYTEKPSTSELERATIVLAAPPSSNTGLRDVVDLAIARGGDMHLLETLTCPEPEQPRELLVEQMSTLRHALGKPNVQLLIYEVHTSLPSETSQMVQQAVQLANDMAVDKYRRDHPPRKKSPPRESTGRKSRNRRSQSSDHPPKSNPDTEDDEPREIPVPESDLFETCELSELFGENCGVEIVDPGTYLVLIRRKEMMQFNSQFMIKVAEAKGVFGDPNRKDDQLKSQDLQPTPIPSETKSARKGVKRHKVHLDRMVAPTLAALSRSSKCSRQMKPCPRHQAHESQERNQLELQVREARRLDAKRWWGELANLWFGSHASQDYRFHVLRTDPISRRILFPAHVLSPTLTLPSPKSS
ncbi:hypothetical protein QAD02_009639 [Eretmocerus hayati]|uniref:Uncharacterized protein n=1 Tax=Eretmocerus hayati TaxID=131215 RepID=A0ACC2NB97_9HYME|nr:hypothetical protein QAD02_009639 [Eretmocerus hayati]